MTATDDHAINLENVSKVYRIPVKGRETLWGSMAVMLDNLLGRRETRHGMFRHFEALKPMDVRIGRGEAVAIVGRNGSGKSTLLQIIAGTLRASTGEVDVRGSLSALLQLGSGFNPDFTGKENIYLNGAMLGLGRNRIQEKMEDILAFADIGDFVEQPVRTYSTGMRLRLAFAVITAVDPDIMIIDEALSVGDAFFQSRCTRWLEKYVERNKTFICVSHDMFMLQRLCRRGLVLNMGETVFDGNIADAANLYYRLHGKKPQVGRKTGSKNTDAGMKAHADPMPGSEAGGWFPLELEIKERTGTGKVTIERVWTKPDWKKGWQAGEWISAKIEVTGHEPLGKFHAGFGFRDRSGQLIGGFHSFYEGEEVSISKAGERRELSFEIRLDLRPQLYLLVIGLAINHTTEDW